MALTPALAGPYDYGTVVVRVALHIDPNDAHVIAVSEKVPSIIGGVPIRMRSIQVNIDKPNFMINPTNCSADVDRLAGNRRPGNDHRFLLLLQCRQLRDTALQAEDDREAGGGRKGTHRTQNPQMQFDLTTRPGDANIKSLSVTLSSAFAIDQRHLGNICAEKELAATQCAGRTPIGKASTTTPLLEKPLEGPVYAVSGSGGLPKLAFILNGQVNLMPRAETKTVVQRRRRQAADHGSSRPRRPDRPLRADRLRRQERLPGQYPRASARRSPVTKVDYTAQNGKSYSADGQGQSRPAARSRRRRAASATPASSAAPSSTIHLRPGMPGRTPCVARSDPPIGASWRDVY